MAIDPAQIYGINPWIAPPSGPGQTTQGFNAFNNYQPTTPYYNPFQVGPEAAAGPITSSPIAECQEGYVKDEETGTCVPVEEAVAAVERGDRDRSSFGPVSDGKGQFISFADMFDGGGAGFRGRNFEGGIGNLGIIGGLAQKGLNYITDPRGSKGRNWDAPVQAMSDFSIDELIDKGYATEEQVYRGDDTASDHFKNAASGTARVRDSDDDERIVTTYNTDKVLATGNTDKYGSPVVRGRNTGGLIAMNTGGSVMNPMIAYRNVGGPAVLPGAVPPNQPAPAAPPMDPAMAQPQAPVAPPPPPAPMTFAEKVEAARQMIKSGRTSVPMAPELSAPMMDAQGDGPVMIHPEAGGVAPGMVGPDMGVDDIDTELEEGSMVMNPEASEMYAEELQMMMKGGVV